MLHIIFHHHRTLTTLNILLNSLQRAYFVIGIVIDCAYFIAEYPAAVGRQAQRRSRTGEVADAPAVRRAHSLSPRSWAVASACRSNRDAAGSCGWSRSSSFDTGDGKTRRRRGCRTARACPESVALMSNNMKRCVDSRGIPAAHWSRPTRALAVSAEYC